MNSWKENKRRKLLSASLYDTLVDTPSYFKSYDTGNILPEEFIGSFDRGDYKRVWVDDKQWWNEITSTFMAYLIYNKYSKSGAVLSEYILDLNKNDTISVELLDIENLSEFEEDLDDFEVTETTKLNVKDMFHLP